MLKGRRTRQQPIGARANELPRVKDSEGWTAQQRVFFDYWCKFNDPKKAARIAGYKARNAANKLQEMEHIKKERDEWELANFERLSDLEARTQEWNDNEILSLLVAVTRNDFIEYYKDEPDAYGILHVKTLKELSYVQRLLIAKITTKSHKIDKETNVLATEYEFLSKEWATDKLAQTFGTYRLAEIAEKYGMTPEVALGHKIAAKNLELDCD